MIIYRYLTKEVFLTMLSSTLVLLFIFMSTQFIHYLSAAAVGKYSEDILMHIMALQIPYLLGLLLPAGFFLSLLLAYGRLAADREMVVLTSCGFSLWQLTKLTILMSVFVAILVGILNFWISPIVAGDQKALINQAKQAPLIETVLPGQFFASPDGKEILYIAGVSRDHVNMQNLFLAQRQDDGTWGIVLANSASDQLDKFGHHLIVIKDGKRYTGAPGTANFQIEQFENYTVRLSDVVPPIHTDEQTMSTPKLITLLHTDPNAQAEWQWRISMPLSVLILAILAIPLSQVNPRQGRFGQLLPAVVIYIFYANCMFLVRTWIQSKTIPNWLGAWWLHLIILAIAIGMLAKQQRWISRIKYKKNMR